MKVKLKNINMDESYKGKIDVIAWGTFFVYKEEIYIRTPSTFIQGNCIRLMDGLVRNLDKNAVGTIIPHSRIKKLIFKGFKEDIDE